MARGTIVTRTDRKGRKRYNAAIWVQTPGGGKRQQWKAFDKRKEAEAFLDERSREVRDGDYCEPIPVRFEDFAAEWKSTPRSPTLAR